MARINIEDDLYKQRGWFDLLIALQSPDTAIGALVRAWTVAQEYWFPNREPIPEDVWKSERLANELVHAGFAVQVDGGYMMTGNEKRFKWLFASSENGKKSADRSTASKKTKTPQSSTGQAQVDHAQPPTPTLPLSPSLSPILSQDNTNTGDVLDFETAQEKSAGRISKGISKSKSKINPDQVIDLFNSILPGVGKLKFCHGLGSPSIRNMLDSFEKFPNLSDWEAIFLKVKSTKKITGEEAGVFLATLDWLSIKENALKVVNGKYDIEIEKKPSKMNSYELTDDEVNQLRDAGEL